MTSRNLSCKLLRSHMKRNLWALTLSVIGFFFAMPLPLLITVQRTKANEYLDPENMIFRLSNEVGSMLGTDNPLARVGMVIMALLCGVAMFRYLHSRMQVDFYHSQPISRPALFGIQYGSGLLLVVPAYLVMKLLSVGLTFALGCGQYIKWNDLLLAVGNDLLLFLLVYTIAALCTIVTGHTIIGCALTAWTLLAPEGALLVWSGYASEYYMTFVDVPQNLYRWATPLSMLFINNHDVIDFVYFIALLVLAFALAYLAFVRRPSERAGSALAFHWLRLPLKATVCLLASGCMGFVFCQIAEGVSPLWLWFGLIAGAFLSHWFMEVALSFDFGKIFAHTPTAIALTALSCLLVVGMQYDVTRFDTHLPGMGSIEGGKIENLHILGPDGSEYADSTGLLEEPENIERIYRLAEIGVAHTRTYGEETGHTGRVPYDDAGRDGYRILLSFRRSAGREMNRVYLLPMNAEVEGLLADTYYSQEALAAEIVFEPLAKGQHAEMSIRSDLNGENEYYLTTREDPANAAKINEITAALQRESLALTYEQVQKNAPVFFVTMWLDRVVDGSRYRFNSVPVYKTYTETLALIEAYTGMKPAPLTLDEVESVEFYVGPNYFAPSHQAIYDLRALEEEEAESAARETVVVEAADAKTDIYNPNNDFHPVEITDELEKAVLLENAMSGYNRFGAYTSNYVHLDVRLKNGNCDIFYYLEGQEPTALIEKYFGEQGRAYWDRVFK